MAGDWIKMRLDLADDPAVMEMAEILGMTEPCVVGYLHTIWSWASRHCNAGTVTGVTLESLGRVTRCTNVPEAMHKVGWLEVLETGGRPSLQFPKWDRHNSQSAKSRALTKKRVDSHRLKKCNDDSVTKALPEKRREEKRREENKKTPKPPSVDLPDIPESLDVPVFRDAWGTWTTHRSEIKKKLTPMSVSRQFAKLARMGPARAAAAIEYSVANGWTGIFEESEKAGTKDPPKPGPRPGETMKERYERYGYEYHGD